MLHLTQGFLRLTTIIALVTLVLSSFQVFNNRLYAQQAIPAFPGAYGYGATATGGRGGTVCVVTNLNDAGPGSLRACIAASGPRIVVFRTGGTITLRSRLEIINPDITIAGQTAPGGGITLRSNGMHKYSTLRISTNNVIIRNLTLRPGPNDKGSNELSAIRMNGERIMLDHLSLSWGTDEVFTAWSGNKGITLQNSIVAQALNCSTHLDEEIQPGCPLGANAFSAHSMGALFGGGSSDMTFYRNLFAHNWDRNPRIASGNADVVNNLTYNYQLFAADLGNTNGPAQINYLGNLVKKGPISRETRSPIRIEGKGVAYIAPNNLLIEKDGQISTRLVADEFVANKATALFTGRPTPPVLDPQEAARQIVAPNGAGATIAVDCAGQVTARRDAIDQAVINDVAAGTGKLIDHPRDSQTGGWVALDAGTPCADQDTDGLPDAWESRYFTSAEAASPTADVDSDGYANIEEYINGTAPQIAETVSGNSVMVIKPTRNSQVGTDVIFAPIELSLPTVLRPIEQTSITTRWANNGTAPSNYDWQMWYQLRDSAGTVVWEYLSQADLRTVQPTNGGFVEVTDKVTLPTSVRTGTYTLTLIVRDPTNVRTPLVLAIVGQQTDGSYQLSSVQVGDSKSVNLTLQNQVYLPMINK